MMASMKIRLSHGVVASGLSAWAPGRSGPVPVADEPDLPLGDAIALGPAGATEEQVRRSVDELARLVAAGGTVAAGAGVDLGSGFRSARLAGARGDQRDAVLAALRVLGVEQAGRLGDRAGYLVALFGPAATKRVGAAAAQAIADGRWAAVQLASAASDVLGPEQLERVLALRPPEGSDFVQGPASSLAGHLRRVLGPLPGPRRLELLLDLWARVEERHAGLARRERLLATQSRRNRVEDLRQRRRHDDDELILSMLRATTAGSEPSLADAARWTPPRYYWHNRLGLLMQDALAATALLRTAVAVADHGLEDGLARSAALLGAAEALLPAWAVAAAVRKVPGLTGLPARPGAYVRDIHRRLSGDRPRDHRFAGFVRPRLACARDFALVIIDSVGELLDESPGVRDGVLRSWASPELRRWRTTAGYSPVRPPAAWEGIPSWTPRLLGDEEALSRRLAARPGQGSQDVEVVGDMLWYADLVDALAALYGHSAARGPLGTGFPWLDHDPPPPAEPLSPRLESVTLAVSGAAQLVALGASPPPHVRTWADFTGGLLAGTSIAEAITGEFQVPAPLAAMDATIIAGTSLTLRVARNARTLAEWSDYMGNCIAGQDYVDLARAGRSVLTGLYDKNGVLIVNAELVPRRPAVRGWRVGQIAARFNHAPDEATERRFHEWAEALPAAAVAETVPARPDEAPPSRTARRRPVPRLVEDAGPALAALARRAWQDEADGEVPGAFAALAGTAPDAALARLRRLRPGALADACSRALEAGTVTLHGLWAASGVRPLAAAVAALDPALRDRFGQLSLLFGEPPMPKSLRRLVRLPMIADAYALDLAGRGVRGAIGSLALRDDPVIARALAGRAAEPLLCALTLLITCRAPGIDLVTVAPPRAVTVPGYPATALNDEAGPWQRALPCARELGAETSALWEEISERGLRVPASWLAGDGWTALWARATGRSHKKGPIQRRALIPAAPATAGRYMKLKYGRCRRAAYNGSGTGKAPYKVTSSDAGLAHQGRCARASRICRCYPFSAGEKGRSSNRQPGQDFGGESPAASVMVRWQVVRSVVETLIRFRILVIAVAVAIMVAGVAILPRMSRTSSRSPHR